MILLSLLISLQNSAIAVSLRGASWSLRLLEPTNTAVCWALAALLVVALLHAPRLPRPAQTGLLALGAASSVTGGLLFVAEPFAYASLAKGGLEAMLVLAALLFIALSRPRAAS